MLKGGCPSDNERVTPPPVTLARDVWELFDVSVSTSPEGLETYLRRVLGHALRWFEASAASAFVRGDDGEIRLAAQVGSGSHVPAGAVVHIGQGVAGKCLELGQALLIRDPRDEPLLAHAVAEIRPELNSSMVIPLSTPEHGKVGVLNLSRRVGMPAYAASDLEQATAVGKQIALAVGNALLLAEAKRAEEKVRALLDAVEKAVFAIDTHGVIAERNLEASKVTGESETLEGAEAALAPELAEALRDGYRLALLGELTSTEARQADTGRVWTVRCKPLSNGALAVVEEITERERATAERAQLHRLAEIGQMSAAIAHEIRNPLTGIRSAAQMLLVVPEQQAELAGIIEDEVMKLNSLCDEFLDFAKPIVLKVRPLMLSKIAGDVVEREKSRFREAQVDLRLEICDGEPTIIGDRLRLDQVVRNLLLNALQASRARDSVIVRIDPYGLSITDFGTGMDQATLERLFTPFYTTKPNGTGLGLSTVKKIVDAHRGTIEVVSKPGEGTSFCLKLRGER